MTRILVADDDAASVEELTSILRREEFLVEVAGTSREALTLLERTMFHLVLTEVYLPDAPGLSLVEQTQARGIGTPFLIVTGFGSYQSAVEALRIGAVDYVEKPLTRRELVEVVRRGLRARTRGTRASELDRPVTPHAARRWACAVATIPTSGSDLRTLAAWARHAGVSEAVLKSTCVLADVSSRRSLVLGRLTRALLHQQRYGLRLEDLLDVHDPRTITSWCTLGGTPKLDRGVDTFLLTQQLVPNRTLIRELQHALPVHSGAIEPGPPGAQPATPAPIAGMRGRSRRRGGDSVETLETARSRGGELDGAASRSPHDLPEAD